jgi:ferrous iron transport protein A
MRKTGELFNRSAAQVDMTSDRPINSRQHVHHRRKRFSAHCAGCPAGVFPLSMAPCNECVRLVDVAGGRTVRRRLAELGLNPGCNLRIVQSRGHGPLILAVKDDTRMAIGRGMAHRIMVEATGEDTKTP